MVRCSDGTLYTGITRDVARRVAEHNGKRGRGAKYTKGRRPVLLSYTETQPGRSCALKRETVIKRLPKADKEWLVLELLVAIVLFLL
ncbi:MAG: GIY-YIG nuclease family protein [Nitrospirae bacterium]|nr:GIY-YIG nuclease family protein [Candidatus Troglogloeales bacterium]